ncbi:PopZ family protein [Bradyrhizobium sp. STM 3557]|uniref:PopZ family protein n=1 Tax=Bradyrhizobium sp. STM 3557 TaxID=578920 RepID=UPI003890CF6D
MTQPAKVQEPSMEEILASIRRIIADDEGKPPAAEKAAPAPEPPRAEKPAAKPVMNDIPPSKIPAAVAAAAKAPPPAPAPPAAASASNNQDDIDALLAGLDETTTPEEVRPAQPEPEVLELTDDMAVAPPISAPSTAAASFRKVEPQDDIDFVEPASRATPRAPAAYDSPAFEATARQAILSQNTVNSVESAFNALANTVLSNNARTLEDLVKEMLRPMLKSWLDDNLPALVERIVKAEIERVSRGR